MCRLLLVSGVCI